jgi:elongation factor Ts
MTEISATLVRDLREMSGAGMMDCKKALAENGGDLTAALDWLRKKGVASASKKAGRVTAEGLVAVAVSGNSGAVIELNSETDFVAKNDQFQALAAQIAKTALGANLTAGSELESTSAAKLVGAEKSVAEEIVQAIAVIGENMNLRRVAKLSVSDGVVVDYVHSQVSPSLGKIGVLVALESTGDKAKLSDLGKQIAMHIAAARPESLNIDGVDPQALEREKEILREQSKSSGKPAEIIEKMMEGRVRKYYEEVVLLEQLFVIDGKTKISEVVQNLAKEIGAPVTLTNFVRYALGEGVEKKESNFAEEVAATAKSAA